MSSLLVQPQLVATAAAKVAGIGSTINAATAAAAASTTGVVAAASDEVSLSAAAVFDIYAKDYQALLKQAAAFHEQFAAALASANAAYLAAEAEAQTLLFAPSPGGGGMADPPLPPQLQGTQFGVIIGGSGLPIPPPSYVTSTLNYVNQNFNVMAGNAQALFTPEGLYPLTGVKSLPLNTSVTQGIQILDNQINATLTANPTGSVAVLGYSQSAIISSLVMDQIAHGQWPYPNIPTPQQLGFTLLGNEMNPNGGALERFVGLNLPSLGITAYGATPPNTPYPTAIYTLEYDGFADFPQYPINFISDLNAVAGIAFVHGTYPMINPATLPPGHVIELPGSSTLPGGTGNTNYYIITHPDLPLLAPLRALPVIGNPLADLVQPDLSVIVNLGYGSTTQGWSPGPANVPTPFGLLPPVSPGAVFSALAAGAPQGVNAFMGDVHVEAPIMAANLSPAGLTSMITSAGTGAGAMPATLTAALSSPDNFIDSLKSANSSFADSLSGGLANAYSILLPTADIANGLLISMPSYDVNLFLSGVQEAVSGDPVGGLVYAFGAPVAADTGIVTLAGGIELLTILDAL
jgi:hypothetical protein